MESIRNKEWEECIAQWGTLERQIREGVYELPIACLVFNGRSTALIICDVRVVSGKNICDTVVEVITEGTEHSPPLRITYARPATFKAGKDRGGTGKSIFLANLDE